MKRAARPGAGPIGPRALAAAALLLAAADVAPEEKEAPLRVVFIAYENPDRLVEDVRPVVEYLRERLKVPVRHFAATDYAGVVEALRNGTADAGFMGPLPYVIAHDQAGATAILGELYGGSPTYVSRIFVRRDSGIRRVEDLRGRTIAFTDPISSSGYLYPLEVFREAGLLKDRAEADRFFKKVYFAGGDEQAIRAVLNRFVDAAGVGEFSHALLRPEERDEVTPIAASRPIPSHCVVVRKGLPPDRVKGLREALLTLRDGPRRELLRHLYNVDGYVPVTHETYEEVERLAREHGFLKGK